MARKKKVHISWGAGSAPEIMDIAALSKYLGMGHSTLYALIRDKKIPASRIGRQYRFTKSEIDAWLKSKLITGKD